MKKILNSLFAVSAAMLLTVATFAQDRDNYDQRVVTDQAQIQKLGTDLNVRTPATKDQTVGWSETAYGYTGMYVMDKADYMVSYDKKGNYIETFRKKEWNDPAVSSSFKTAFGASQYKDSEITSYWEAADPNRKGYYVELKDKSGKKSRMWADDKGKFYDKPYNSTDDKAKTPNGN